MRQLSIIESRIIKCIGAAFSTFILLTAAFNLMSFKIQLAVFLCFMIPMAFLLYPATKSHTKNIPIYDWVCATAFASTMGWIVVCNQRLLYRIQYIDEVTNVDFIMGVICIVLLLEAVRRVLGWILIVIAGFFLLYSNFGQYFPGLFSHRGFLWVNIIDSLYLGRFGVFNAIVGVIATYVAIFVIFGAFLDISGLGSFYINICLSIAGKTRGGPAKVAVIASALFGSISGSTIANVITTGTFTIPLMKKTGYKDYEAAAIETAASTGGAIMPPVMGAGAFLMADFTGIPYLEIVKLSIIPALMYYATVFCFVHLKASAKGLQGIPKNELPSFWDEFKNGVHLLIPVILLVYLLVKGRTPYYAGFYSIIFVVLISFLNKKTMMTPAKIFQALADGARNMVQIVTITTVAALIVGVIVQTGFVTKAAAIIVSFAGGYLIIAILLNFIISYILGMALPVTTCYMLQAVVAVPAFIMMNVPVITAHMLVFWYSQLAAITPPICTTAFTAAAIAKAPPMKTGYEALKIAHGFYLIPLLFVYSGLITGPLGTRLWVGITATFAMFAIAFLIEGWFLTKMATWERLLLLPVFALLFHPAFYTDIIGLVVMAVVGVSQFRKSRKRKKLMLEASG